jgi:hypothetical protein
MRTAFFRAILVPPGPGHPGRNRKRWRWITKTVEPSQVGMPLHLQPALGTVSGSSESTWEARSFELVGMRLS